MKTTQKKAAVKKVPTQELQPKLKWQTGDYQRNIEFKSCLPYQFLLLCKLTETTPKQVLSDFLDNLSCGSWKREGREKGKEYLINYFIDHGYGQHHYTVEDLRQIFKEMDAVGMLFPKNAGIKMIKQYGKWRDKYHRHWFKKWFRKPRRIIQRPTS